MLIVMNDIEFLFLFYSCYLGTLSLFYSCYLVKGYTFFFYFKKRDINWGRVDGFGVVKGTEMFFTLIPHYMCTGNIRPHFA